uniref:Ig-like domain-containing protein n=1 Tax=Trichuris muris TaxID=70415 RepID=A0A5S6QWP2_TRIMR
MTAPKTEGHISLNDLQQLVIGFLLESRFDRTVGCFAQRKTLAAETFNASDKSGMEMVTLVNSGIRYIMSLKNIPMEQFPKNCEELVSMLCEHRILEEYYEFSLVTDRSFEAVNLHSIQVEREISVFNHYHECIDEHSKSTKRLSTVAPRLVTVRERSVVRLDCTPCPNPRSTNPRRFWFYRLWMQEDLIDVPLASSSFDESGFLLIENFILLITEADKEKHNGEYVCTDIYGHPLSTYYLDIIPAVSVEMTSSVEIVEVEAQEYTLEDENVLITYQWGSWTACNRCFLGERRRYAYCVLKPSTNASAPVRNRRVANLLRLFPEGVPCYSSWVPPEMRLRPEVARPIKIASHFCMIDCPTEPPERNITEGNIDGSEKVVERLKRGFISRDDELPPRPPRVFRQVHHVEDGGAITLYCPHGNEEVYWQKEDTYLPTPVLGKYANGRIYYTREGHMVFASTLGSDSGFYSCWRFDNVLLLSARLHVEDPRTDMAIRAAIISGGGVVFLTFTCIIACSYIRARPMKTN